MLATEGFCGSTVNCRPVGVLQSSHLDDLRLFYLALKGWSNLFISLAQSH